MMVELKMSGNVTEVFGGHEKYITQMLCWEENSWPWVLAADPLAPHLSSTLSISSNQPMTGHDDDTSSDPFFWDVQFLKWETLHCGFQFGLAKTFIKLYCMIKLFSHAPFFYLFSHVSDLYVLAFFSLVFSFHRHFLQKIFFLHI